jgi:hypothetical protein
VYGNGGAKVTLNGLGGTMGGTGGVLFSTCVTSYTCSPIMLDWVRTEPASGTLKTVKKAYARRAKKAKNSEKVTF